MMCTDEECYNIEIHAFSLIKNASNITSPKNTSGRGNGTEPYVTNQVVSEDSEVGLIVLFTLTTVLSIFGNALVVLVFKRGRRSRTDLRPFLINLAIADLIMAIVCMPFTFIYTMLNTWVFSKPMCTIVCFVQLMSVAGSVFTNMAIGIDRFLAVAFPLRSRLTKKRAKYVICVIWICSTGISSLQIYAARGVDYDNGQTTCEEKWASQGARRTYTVFVFVFTYVIPLLILSITYSIIGILLWKRTAPGNRDHARDMHQLRSKRKTVMAYIQHIQDVLGKDGVANRLARETLQQFEAIRQMEADQARAHRLVINQMEDYRDSLRHQTTQIQEERTRIQSETQEAKQEHRRFQSDLSVVVQKAKGRYRYMNVRTVTLRRPDRH